jgi:hypothetical protein
MAQRSATPNERRASAAGALLLALVAGCEGDDTSLEDALAALDPPTLELTAVYSALGQSVETSGGALGLGCDRRLVVSVGPRTSDGQLVDWLLRPRGNCSDIDPCGYVQVVLKDAEGEPVASAQAAGVDVALWLGGAELDRVTQVEAWLVQGQSERPYLVDGERVTDTWELSLEDAGCAGPEAPGTGTGGAGSGGTGTGGGPGLGGLGGLGGAG